MPDLIWVIICIFYIGLFRSFKRDSHFLLTFESRLHGRESIAPVFEAMDSQLSTYPLIALLKHYPKASFCRRAPRCLRTTPSSSKSIHSLPRCRRHRATLQAERSRRRFQSWRKPSADRGFLSLPASSAKFDSTQAHTAREGRQGASRGHERKPADGERVAVLGGGISGLAYAYYLAKEFPATKITIFEASNRLGGWLNTQKVNVGDGTVIFEQGPRTLQPHTISSIATLSMVG